MLISKTENPYYVPAVRSNSLSYIHVSTHTHTHTHTQREREREREREERERERAFLPHVSSGSSAQG
jgi:hypothetical protein